MAIDVLTNFLIAFAVGLIIGIERGWKLRDQPEGRRVAGIRTFILIALVGATTAHLANWTGEWILLVSTAGLLIFLTAFYLHGLEKTQDKGATTEVAAALTFFLGALAMLSSPLVVAGVTGLVLLVLGLKSPMHRMLKSLDKAEISALFQLIFLTAIVLPFLPNKGIGPGEIFNPSEIWLLVVFVQSISFFGHFAVRVFGSKTGILAMSVFSGFVSTTALTLDLARLAKHKESEIDLLSSGLAASCAVQAVRVLILAGLVNPAVLALLAPPMLAVCLSFSVVAIIFHNRSAKIPTTRHKVALLPSSSNILTAFVFAALVAGVLFASYYASQRLEGQGVIALAAVAGLVDVDAITISMAKLSHSNLIEVKQEALIGIMAAFVSSMVSKIGISMVLGNRAFAWRVTLIFIVTTLSGFLGFELFI